MAQRKQEKTTENLPSVRDNAELMRDVLVAGDLSTCTPSEIVSYMTALCDSLRINILTRPFELLKTRDGRVILYARKECAEQLRLVNSVSIEIVAREHIAGCYVVSARASCFGRVDESTGAVTIEGLKGEALANALMKAETKAKRRVTLSICGLGFSDESEVDDIPGARRVTLEAVEAVATSPAQRLSELVDAAIATPENREAVATYKLSAGQYKGVAVSEIPVDKLAKWLRKYEQNVGQEDKVAIVAWLRIAADKKIKEEAEEAERKAREESEVEEDDIDDESNLDEVDLNNE